MVTVLYVNQQQCWLVKLYEERNEFRGLIKLSKPTCLSCLETQVKWVNEMNSEDFLKICWRYGLWRSHLVYIMVNIYVHPVPLLRAFAAERRFSRSWRAAEFFSLLRFCLRMGGAANLHIIPVYFNLLIWEAPKWLHTTSDSRIIF